MAASNGDGEQFARYGSELADAVHAALPGWIRQQVEQRLAQYQAVIGERGTPPTQSPDLDARLVAAGERARSELIGELRNLLALDVDDQWTNPLSILRTSTRYPTEILAELGVPPIDRDDHARRLHPEDQYDLTPGTFAEFGPEVHECGIRWGAAKAHLHLTRRKGS